MSLFYPFQWQPINGEDLWKYSNLIGCGPEWDEIDGEDDEYIYKITDGTERLADGGLCQFLGIFFLKVSPHEASPWVLTYICPFSNGN